MLDVSKLLLINDNQYEIVFKTGKNQFIIKRDGKQRYLNYFPVLDHWEIQGMEIVMKLENGEYKFLRPPIDNSKWKIK